MGRTSTRPNLVFGRSFRILTMMQSYASAAKLRAAAPILESGVERHGLLRVAATSDRDRNRRDVARQAPRTCRISC